eukprot:837794-Rhodomonas_salina.2
MEARVQWAWGPGSNYNLLNEPLGVGTISSQPKSKTILNAFDLDRSGRIISCRYIIVVNNMDCNFLSMKTYKFQVQLYTTLRSVAISLNLHVASHGHLFTNQPTSFPVKGAVLPPQSSPPDQHHSCITHRKEEKEKR